MLTNIFYLNEQGKRKNIEDNIFPTPGKATANDKLFLVCDGVGGLSKGEEASRIACEGISEYILALPSQNISENVIEAAVDAAVDKMRDYAAEHPVAEQMSTTLTLVYLQDNGAWTAWCGDSRVYHIRNGKIIWQSKDHSLVQQLVEAGEITQEEALHHPQKNIILRSLSAANVHTNIDTHFIADLAPGDHILLCTDGVLENIGESEIMAILGPQQKEADKKKLFLQYCFGKTSDNFSMYLLQLDKAKKSTIPAKKMTALVIALIAAIITAGIVSYRNHQRSFENNIIHHVPADTSKPQNAPATSNASMLNMLEQKIKKDSPVIKKEPHKIKNDTSKIL